MKAIQALGGDYGSGAFFSYRYLEIQQDLARGP